MTTIAVVDHGAGNLISIARGLERSGAQVTIATRPGELAGHHGIVLPGVGSSGAAMRRLSAVGLDRSLRAWEGPLLGICVGFQLLFESSEEGPEPCLGMIPGRVVRLKGTPLPHMGWNDVRLVGVDPIFSGVSTGELFSFVHSYAPFPTDAESVLATTEYAGETIVAAARSGSVVGTQFHPERSGPAGQALLSNFVDGCKEADRAA